MEKELGYELAGAYEEEFEDAEIVRFNDTERRIYTIFFDLARDDGTDIYGRAARVVWVHGRSAPAATVRNHSRMRGFLGTFRDQPQYAGYDKGHFVAHCNDGQVDQNLYPQLRELNRGLSPQGKLFRSMERYVQQNEGVFFLSAPFTMTLPGYRIRSTSGFLRKKGGCC